MSNSRVSVLKLPLDLSLAVDREIYDIVSGFKSGVEAKNFLCSAILYYARSPLVLSANALSARLDKLESALSKLDFSYTGLQSEKIPSKLDEVVASDGFVQDDKPMPSFSQKGTELDSVTVNALVSLRDKFKV